MTGPETPDQEEPESGDDWIWSTVKVRVDGVRGALAAQTIAYVDRMLTDQAWRVSRFETRETWAILHFPAGATESGGRISREVDRAALADFEALVSAVQTASMKARRSFVLILDDEEVGSISGGSSSPGLERDVLGPWRRMV